MRSDPEPHLWRQAAELTPLAGGGTFAVAAVCFHRLGVLLPVGATVAVWGVVWVATLVVTGHRATAAYAAVCGVTATGWTAYALATSPWTVPAVSSLLIACIVLGPGLPLVRGHHKAADAAARRMEEARRLAAEAQRWPLLLAQLGHKGVTWVSSEETRAGHTHLLRLPAHGRVTLGKLAKDSERVEIAAQLRRGAVRFEEAPEGLAHEVLMHVAEKDILAVDIPFPDDLSNLTVNRPFDVGMHEDGQKMMLLFREIAALVVGLRGAGKSNLINVLVAQLARCVDVVIFMIDNKGGRTARPWLQPWIDGRTDRPVIDWVATTREETELMLRTVLGGIQARAHSGAGGEKVIPSPRIPAVVLIMEEIAVIFGQNMGPRTSMDGTTNFTLAGLGTEIVQLGRSEAIDPVLVTQRGTVTMVGSGDLKSQCALRIGLGVASEADARSIIPDDQVAASVLARLRHAGTGIVSYGDSRPAPVKFYRLTTDRIYEIAEECGHRRPAPDPDLEDAFGDAYRNRWSRQEKLLRRKVVPIGGPERDDDAVFQQIVDGLGPDDLNPSRARMLDILRDRGVRGATVEALRMQLDAEGLGVVRQTIHKWLAEEAQAGRVVKTTYGRYKAA